MIHNSNVVKKIVVPSLLLGAIFIYCSMQTNTGTNSSSISDKEEVSYQKVSKDTDVTEKDKSIETVFQNISDTEMSKLDSMSDEELEDRIQQLSQKYSVGEPFNSFDSSMIAYIYEKQEGLLEDAAEPNPTGWTWNTYNVKNTKSFSGVKVGYSGKLASYASLSGGSYKTSVHVTLYSGKSKLKKLKWTTHHTSYGLLGTNGKNPSIGIIYNGSSSSSSWKHSFSYSKTVLFSSLVPLYTKTWGTLNVDTKSGNYNMNTKTYQHWE